MARRASESRTTGEAALSSPTLLNETMYQPVRCSGLQNASRNLIGRGQADARRENDVPVPVGIFADDQVGTRRLARRAPVKVGVRLGSVGPTGVLGLWRKERGRHRHPGGGEGGVRAEALRTAVETEGTISCAQSILGRSIT